MCFLVIYCLYPIKEECYYCMTKNKPEVKDSKPKNELSEERKRQKVLKQKRKEEEEQTEFDDMLDDADDEVYYLLKKLK